MAKKKATVRKKAASNSGEVVVSDGLANIASGFGGSDDRSILNRWDHSNRNRDHVTLSAMFRESWIAQKLVKIVPEDMTRRWRTFDNEAMQEADELMMLADKTREAEQWARLYGTSFMVLDIDDGRSPSKPINMAKLKKGCIRSINVVDRTRIVAAGEMNIEPMAERFGMPSTYSYVGSDVPIHYTRMLRFEGTELPIYERQRNLWYSDSILMPLLEPINVFTTAFKSAAQMASEANVDVISIHNLEQVLANDRTSEALFNRLQSWKMIKSSMNVSVMDAQEEWEQKNMSLNGIKDMLDKLLGVVCAAVSVPETRFLGTSPAGMNATGHSDMINYLDMLEGQQKSKLSPRLKYLDPIVAKHFGIEGDSFSFKWNCTFPESREQKIEGESRVSESLCNMVNSGILSRESALNEAKCKGLVEETATVGSDPNTSNDNKGGDSGKS